LIRRPVLAVLLTALPLLALVSVAVTVPAPAAAASSRSSVPAYWLVASDGGIFSFGGAPFYGSTGALALNKPIVGMAATPDGGGYWLVASDGGIFSYGDAGFHGSTGSLVLNRPIVGMTSTPDGGGYWLVASDGGIFAFGDAAFYGSTGSMVLNRPVVGMAATAGGGGYWLVASDGGIFAFGDAAFHGSTGSITLNKPVIGMIADPSGGGYFMIASDGGIFSFGTAPFYGSLGGLPLKNPVVAAAATTSSGTLQPSGQNDVGYWFTDDTGLVSNFGSADYFGSAPSPLNRPIVGMAEAPGNGGFVGSPFPSGSYGYDISNFQCPDNFPSGDHQIGIVQVDGASDTSTQLNTAGNYANPCLQEEAGWAGAGLNLYTFLTYQTSTTPEPGCSSDPTGACNAGYQAGIDAFGDAQQPGVNTDVTWWLDVENVPSNPWSGSTASNAAFVMGALNALHETEGLANVGIYASPGVWNSIVGDYQPSVPYWMADYLASPSGPGSCADYSNWVQNHGAQLPGPPILVQYDSQQYDEDYAC
jgi:hypothetical protein